MKFQQVREGEYRAYSNPFTFWIFEEIVTNSFFNIVWHYSDASGQEKGLSTFEAAKEWCYQFALKQTLKQLQEIAPEGGRTIEMDLQYKFVCDGAIHDMGWRCCLPIGHAGDCYTRSKKVFFKRENGNLNP